MAGSSWANKLKKTADIPHKKRAVLQLPSFKVIQRLFYNNLSANLGFTLGDNKVVDTFCCIFHI